MNALPATGELFATNQVSPETERCYKYQLRNFAEWMRDIRSVEDMEDVTLQRGRHDHPLRELGLQIHFQSLKTQDRGPKY